jgi:hypothetical protein
MKRALLLFAVTFALAAQTTRIVTLSWTASTTSGVTGYNVWRSTAVFTSIAGMTPLNSSPVAATAYQDTTAVIGSTYTYGVTAVAAACTPATPVGTACGSSALSPTVTTAIPAQPGATSALSVTVP